MKKIKFKGTVNLAETKFGSKIIYKTDEFFGAADRILSADKPIFKEGIYDKHGKWMDGRTDGRTDGRMDGRTL